MKIHIKSFDDLTRLELYHILKKRQEFFVVEQKICYLDVDGKDLYSIHFWYPGETSQDILAYLRMVPEKAKKEVSIGRVLTTPSARGKGLARQLTKEAFAYWRLHYQTWALHLHAQEYLRGFYESLGFEVTGPVFCYPDEDPLPHVPMVYKE